MIKVLNRVELLEERIIQHQCNNCTSTLELKPKTDAIFRQDQCDGSYWEFHCPVCSAK